MSPAPSVAHHDVAATRIFVQWQNRLRRSVCKPFIAPVDVLLSGNGQQDDQASDVVQPDLFIVCDKSRIDERLIRGAPEVIVEILSPSTARKDQTRELALYESSGVKEYWMLHPQDRVLTIYSRSAENPHGRPHVVAAEGLVSLITMPDSSVDFEDVFAE